ncbi:extensin [Streptomyces sp. NPDC090741]|uniref:extensin n=1 Tax=Streptomyces sp. NPDC090741 TaxID=3365967 RepID=UPI0038064315
MPGAPLSAKPTEAKPLTGGGAGAPVPTAGPRPGPVPAAQRAVVPPATLRDADGPEALPVRALAPARALTSALPSTAQRVHSPRPQAKTAVPLHRGTGTTAAPVAPTVQRTATGTPVRALAVQRLAAPAPAPAPRTGPAAAAAATHPPVPPRPPVPHTPQSPPSPPPPPPPRTVQRASELTTRKTSTTHTHAPVPDAAFNPRSLTEFQLDELTHRLISRITRQLRTEFRLDRERIGKLRDPRH